MKCAACQYEHLPDQVIEEPLLYKTGPKKGQVRTIEKRTVKFDKFIEIEVGEGAIAFTRPAEDSWDHRAERAYLYACPQCFTVRMERGW